MTIVKRLFIFFLGIILVFGIGFMLWASYSAPIMTVADNAIHSTNVIVTQEDNALVFSPKNKTAKIGYIYYPGGRVDHRAYAPHAASLARRGFLVAVVKMPLNLAVFGSNRAANVIQEHPEISKWVIGGHSLGGVMAAHFLNNHPGTFAGIIFTASNPAEGDNLSNYPGAVLSISASKDGLAAPEKIKASASLLPPQTVWVVIEGGNHANFGFYGNQAGDQIAAISREEQQKIYFESTITLLSSLK